MLEITCFSVLPPSSPRENGAERTVESPARYARWWQHLSLSPFRGWHWWRRGVPSDHWPSPRETTAYGKSVSAARDRKRRAGATKSGSIGRCTTGHNFRRRCGEKQARSRSCLRAGVIPAAIRPAARAAPSLRTVRVSPIFRTFPACTSPEAAGEHSFQPRAPAGCNPRCAAR